MKRFFKFRRHAAIAFILALVVFPLNALASDTVGKTKDDARPAPMPFEPSEQLVYDGDFSRSLLRGIKIAEFKFTALRVPATSVDSNAKPTNGAEAPTQLLLVSDVTSDGWFRKLFGINFHFRVESMVEREGFAVLRTTKLDEQGKRVRKSETSYDRAGKKISFTETDPNDPKRPPRVVNSPLEGSVHDILSAIYFLRTQPLTPNQSFELSLSDSGRVYRVPVNVTAERKVQKTVLGKVKVLRIDIGLFGKDRPVEGKGKMSMWVTDDARRIPIRARMSSDIGMLDIKLKKFSNNPAAETKSK